jgi:hypothetical protein
MRNIILAVTAAAALAGCATNSVSSDALKIDAAVQVELPVILPLLPPAQAALLTKAAAAEHNAVLALQGAPTGTTATAYLADVEAVLASIPTGVLPPNVATVITAVEVLIPVVAADFAVTAPVGASKSAMTPAQARNELDRVAR